MDKKINAENLRSLCWGRGYRGVVGLARSLKCARPSVYRAVAYPAQHAPLFNKILKALQ